MTIKPLILNMRPDGHLSQHLAVKTSGEIGTLIKRNFPDGETYLRIDSRLESRDVIIVANLHDPDYKILPLLFAANAARTHGAYRVGLVAPYLPYMRQDKAFLPGESISARYFAGLLSEAFDWLATVDPHLHRIKELGQLYTLSPVTVGAGAALIHWIKKQDILPVIIGPDSESRQWVKTVADGLDAPFLVGDKSRAGDRAVIVKMPDPSQFRGRTPIILDDIISTGRTVLEVIQSLEPHDFNPPICLAVHAIMQDGVESDLLRAGAKQIVTTNAIDHPTNAINVDDLICDAVVNYYATSKFTPLRHLV